MIAGPLCIELHSFIFLKEFDAHGVDARKLHVQAAVILAERFATSKEQGGLLAAQSELEVFVLFSELLRFLWESLVIEGVDPSDYQIAQRIGVDAAVLRERALSDVPLARWDLEMLLLVWNHSAEGYSVVVEGDRLQCVPKPVE